MKLAPKLATPRDWVQVTSIGIPGMVSKATIHHKTSCRIRLYDLVVENKIRGMEYKQVGNDVSHEISKAANFEATKAC